MGRRIDIYLWAGIAAGLVMAAIGRRSGVGIAGWVIAGGCLAFWVAYLLYTSAPYRKK